MIRFLFLLFFFSCAYKNETTNHLTYLALGDSYTIGESVDHLHSYPIQLKNKLNFKEKVLDKVTIVAKTGWTTDELIDSLNSLEINKKYDMVSLLIGVNNQYTDKSGYGRSILDSKEYLLPELAKMYHEKNIFWIAIGDDNYGEGSSREHAAMEPRFRGCKVVLVKSFARIHEANLKKQGVLPLTFDNPEDYDLIKWDDKISTVNLTSIAPRSNIKLLLSHNDGTSHEIVANHSLSDDQIEWFKAGSALNYLSKKE